MNRIVAAAENALLFYPDTPSPERIRAICEALVTHPEVRELVPAYTSILIYHHSQDTKALQQAITSLVADIPHQSVYSGNTIYLPVYYHPEVAPDLERLAAQKNTSIAKVSAIHSQTTYQVYAVGFAPAFAYLGQVDKTIALPRLNQPRKEIPAGSVGIANQQTAVYPIASPAGWNIIGRTPVDLSPNKPENLTKFSIGDTVIFKPIGREEFLAMGGEVKTI